MTWCDLRSWGSFKDSSYLTVLLIFFSFLFRSPPWGRGSSGAARRPPCVRRGDWSPKPFTKASALSLSRPVPELGASRGARSLQLRDHRARTERSQVELASLSDPLQPRREELEGWQECLSPTMSARMHLQERRLALHARSPPISSSYLRLLPSRAPAPKAILSVPGASWGER